MWAGSQSPQESRWEWAAQHDAAWWIAGVGKLEVRAERPVRFHTGAARAQFVDRSNVQDCGLVGRLDEFPKLRQLAWRLLFNAARREVRNEAEGWSTRECRNLLARVDGLVQRLDILGFTGPSGSNAVSTIRTRESSIACAISASFRRDWSMVKVEPNTCVSRLSLANSISVAGTRFTCDWSRAIDLSIAAT